MNNNFTNLSNNARNFEINEARRRMGSLTNNSSLNMGMANGTMVSNNVVTNSLGFNNSMMAGNTEMQQVRQRMNQETTTNPLNNQLF